MRSSRRSFLLSSAARAAVPLLAAGAWSARGRAQAASPSRSPAELAGPMPGGKMLSLQGLRGKVVLVWFWSTTCAVCRDVLPELRANHAGWRGKPFELVTVATDASRDDVLQYERIVQTIVASKEMPPALWRHDPRYRDNFPAQLSLPMAFLVDPSGHVVEQYAGRIPAVAWDRIAELLP